MSQHDKKDQAGTVPAAVPVTGEMKPDDLKTPVIDQATVAEMLRQLGELNKNVTAMGQRLEAVEQRPLPGMFPGRRQRAQAATMGSGGELILDGGTIEPLMAGSGSVDNICGSEGTVKIGVAELPEITKWTFKPMVTTQEYASNRTNGFKRKVCGSRSGAGTLEGKWDRNDPILDHFREGDSVTLLLHMDDTLNISVPAIIKSMDYEVDMDEGTIVGWSCEFEADEAWTYNLGSGTTTTTTGS